ncbi:MAG TPA: CRISPR system precrRNA processing endoribonuclease RAMP protein Cas6 [Bryobacteraceae bacterium]|nr:CRISPR system precrRNA processing endoribonuclease RAMP protein Cas6 [Bryobacteraceae bacterium]
MTFDLEACRFELTARRATQFPPGMAGNVLRGALGHALRAVACPEDYARIFTPAATTAGPSGLSDWPRPFVIRTALLEGRTVQPGEPFCFDLHLFDTRDPALGHFLKAFAHWADVVSVKRSQVQVELDPHPTPVSRIRVDFRTPTELKTAARDAAAADFSVLLARARDRVSTLRSLYGAGPLEIDFRSLAERARNIKTLRSELRRVAVKRRSSRTGQRHGIGGLVGFAEYEGDLAEFLPYLQAAHWTGVGRHCTWGNGEIQTEILASDF